MTILTVIILTALVITGIKDSKQHLVNQGFNPDEMPHPQEQF